MVANELTIYNATIFETRMATATLALKENFLAETLRQWHRTGSLHK